MARRWAYPSAIRFSISAAAARSSPVRSPIGPIIWASHQCRRWSTSGEKSYPAPWVPFTRAGCDVGAFSVANIEFENTKGDIDNVFGPTSPEHNENLANPDLAVADFEGIAIHCALASPLCGGSAH